jgi:predicted DCC family thiol-disulfide oxidoreductase YuxK
MTPVPHQVSRPPDQLHVLFDGDCGFCRFWVERWRTVAREPTRFEPFQQAASRYPEIPLPAFDEAMQAVDTDGKVYSGADAVFRLLRKSRWRWINWIADDLPILRRLARGAYHFIATNRPVFSKLTRLGWGRIATPPSFAMARRIFAHGLGLIFFTAFGSLALQWKGLIGSRGILPLEWLDRAPAQIGAGIYWRVPSVFWLGHGDGMIGTVIWAGVLISLAMMFGFAPGACALVLWGLYLSICGVSDPFLGYQWDALLLETALIAAIYLPWSVRPQWRLTTRLTTLGRWLLWWLLCRLMLESAIVKLASGDPTWRNLTALTYHYETQPLPLWTAWFAHQAPVWIHKLEALATFAIEFIAPILMVGPRRFRHAGAWAMIALQLGILLTGNYAFFNLLCILLSLLLLEDSFWPDASRRLLLRRLRPPVHAGAPGTASWILEPLGALSAVFTGVLLLGTIWRPLLFSPFESLRRVTAPLRSFNSYGLFASMTIKRPEIVVEGSNDGVQWEPYEFKWKPGDLKRRPRLAEPHQPRLDWQMWFAALSGDARREPWFVQFMVRLLQGSPDVLALIEWNPFPGTPPHYVRARLYDYHFTHFGEGPAWWKRELIGEFCPAISLRAAEEK